MTTPAPEATIHEPTAAELAARPRSMRWDVAEKCWLWNDQTLRQWTPRPDAYDVVRAAIQKQIPAVALARKLRVSIPTLHKFAAGGDVLPIVVQGIAHSVAAIADLTEEL
jgi:hypothetical protein